MTTHQFRKSSASGPNGGNCVEVRTSHHAVDVRHSKDPHGRILTFTPAAWRTLLTDLLAGAPTSIVHHRPDGDVQMHHGISTLTFTTSEWNAFLAGVKNGEFTLPAAEPGNSPLTSATR